MFEHTAGNWRYYKPKNSNGFYYVDTEFSTGGEIATCYFENTEANARLIAAAPEMLDALIEGIKKNAKNGTPVECMYEAVEKATGKPIDQILKESQNV